jgi:hypothetical protein
VPLLEVVAVVAEQHWQRHGPASRRPSANPVKRDVLERQQAPAGCQRGCGDADRGDTAGIRLGPQDTLVRERQEGSCRDLRRVLAVVQQECDDGRRQIWRARLHPPLLGFQVVSPHRWSGRESCAVKRQMWRFVNSPSQVDGEWGAERLVGEHIALRHQLDGLRHSLGGLNSESIPCVSHGLLSVRLVSFPKLWPEALT